MNKLSHVRQYLRLMQKLQSAMRQIIPDSKVLVANMGPIWGRQDPGGPHVGPMNFAIWDIIRFEQNHWYTWKTKRNTLGVSTKQMTTLADLINIDVLNSIKQI